MGRILITRLVVGPPARSQPLGDVQAFTVASSVPDKWGGFQSQIKHANQNLPGYYQNLPAPDEGFNKKRNKRQCE